MWCFWSKYLFLLARPERFELPTSWFEAKKLSYPQGALISPKFNPDIGFKASFAVSSSPD